MVNNGMRYATKALKIYGYVQTAKISFRPNYGYGPNNSTRFDKPTNGEVYISIVADLSINRSLERIAGGTASFLPKEYEEFGTEVIDFTIGEIIDSYSESSEANSNLRNSSTGNTCDKILYEKYNSHFSCDPNLILRCGN